MKAPTTFAAVPIRPVAPPLRAGDIEVWRAPLDDQPPEAVRTMQLLLSADETQRARRFYFDRDRCRYVVGRGILRMLLGRYLGRAPEDLVFRYGANGKPALAGEPAGAPPAIYFNVAHSEGIALYAFTTAGEVGIDLELMRDLPDWERVAEAAFSPRELAQLRACPPDGRREEFFRAWTRQEAVLKARGTGLGGISPAENETAFRVYPLELGAGVAAALAASPAARRPRRVRDWNGAADSGGDEDRLAAATENQRQLQTNFL